MFGLVLCVALLVCAPAPTSAQGLPALQGDLDALAARVAQLETVGIGALQAKVAQLEALLADVTRNGNTLILGVNNGMNLQVVNGMGATDTGATDTLGGGLGNVIVGYDEPYSDTFVPNCEDAHGFGNCVKTGSHNLIVGSGQSYSSWGGLLGGTNNAVVGEFASVTGGGRNTASGLAASVSGGVDNEASGVVAAVSGGNGNLASGSFSAVSGGSFNLADGRSAVVSGGRNNTATGPATTTGGNTVVSGGRDNIASGFTSVVSGGLSNEAVGDASVVGGGIFTTTTFLSGEFPDNHTAP